MRKKISLPVSILIISPAVILFTVLISILYGAKHIDFQTVREAVLHFDPEDVNHQIIIHSRLPRAVGSLLIGAALAISGAIMQGMTRNYLASPGIMGVSDGSAFAVTLCMVFMPGASNLEIMAFSFVGSALGAGLVFGMGSLLQGGLAPVRLAILGTIVGTFLSSISSILSVYFQTSQNISFWYNARLHQMSLDSIKLAIPFLAAGIMVSVLISKSVTILSLGEEVAVGLGQRTGVVKIIASGAVVILTGVSVALAGKIGFVGLIIPHIARFLIGVDYKWSIPCAGALGGIFLALSDVASRFINYPFETPVGVITSLIGVPFFLYLVRKKGGDKRA